MIVIMNLIFFSCGCEGDSTTKKDFYGYTTLGGRHIRRIPTIRPYSILSSDEKSWFFHSEIYGDHAFSVETGKVMSIGIIDTCKFVVYSFFTTTNPYYKWAIINASEKTRIEFKTEEEYLAHLSALGVDSVKLYDNLDNLHNEFRYNKILPPEWEQVIKHDKIKKQIQQ